MDNNLAFIKRKLDQELSDDARKILQETSNPTPKTTIASHQAEAPEQASASVLEHIKLIKLPKYQMHGIAHRKYMHGRSFLRNGRASTKTKEELLEEHLSQHRHFGSFNAREMYSSQPDFEKSLQGNPQAHTRENSLEGGDPANPYVGDYEDDQIGLPPNSRLPSINRESAKHGAANSAMGNYRDQADAAIFRNDAAYHHRESAHFESNTFKDIKDFERRNLSKERRLQE